MTSPYDIDQFIIRKNFLFTDMDSLIEAALQHPTGDAVEIAGSTPNHSLQHDEVTGVEIDAAKLAYDTAGPELQEAATIFHEGPEKHPERFMQAFRALVRVGAPMVNQAIQMTNSLSPEGPHLPLAFNAAGDVTPQWKNGISAPRDYANKQRGTKPAPKMMNGQVVTRLQSSRGYDEAWNRPYHEGLDILRERNGIKGKTRDSIRPGLFHRGAVTIQTYEDATRIIAAMRRAAEANPADPRGAAQQALFQDRSMKAHGPMNMAELDFGRHHPANIAATNQAFARQERRRTGRTGVHPDLEDSPIINHFFNSNSYYRNGKNAKANALLSEKYNVPAEEIGRGIAEIDQQSKESGKTFGSLFNDFLHELARKGNGGKDPDWVDVEPTPEPLTAQQPVTEGRPDERRVPAERPVTEGPQAQPPEWDPFNLDTYGGQPAAPPPPMEQPAPPPPRDESMDRARPAAPERHAQPAPEQPPRPPRGPPQRTPQQAVMAAPPAPQPMAQPERRGYVVSPLGRPVSELPAMQRLAYLLGQRSNLFGKSEDDAHLVREALEAVQIDIAKSEVPPRFMGMGLNVNSLSDVSMAANAVRVTPQDVVSIVHSRGDWDGIAKSFNVTVQDVQKVKVMFNG